MVRRLLSAKSQHPQDTIKRKQRDPKVIFKYGKAGRNSQGGNISLLHAGALLLLIAFVLLTRPRLELDSSLKEPARFSTTPSNTIRCDPSTIFVAIKSGSSSQQYQNRRKKWRRGNCANHYYPNNYKFFLGLPLSHSIDPHSHNQAARDTEEERQLLAETRKEQELFNDTVVLPLRDIYDDFFLKTIHILQWLAQNAPGDIAVLHDGKNMVHSAVDAVTSLPYR